MTDNIFFFFFFLGFSAIQWRIPTENTFSEDSAQGTSVGLQKLFFDSGKKWEQNRVCYYEDTKSYLSLLGKNGSSIEYLIFGRY